ncbi:hypothetical protein QOZ80_3BG0297960 [Eleusine coracana subsp. coracana]|nr:hypothetical protein QOZ80_3BG0297960 [Eleusine coracana subsp. coracana]
MFLQGISGQRRPQMPRAGDDEAEIPIIDFQRLLMDSHEEAARLHGACQEWGFFQLINHGIPHDVVEGMKAGVEGFFQQPAETKKQFAQERGQLDGYGQLFVVSEDQKLDWADILFLNTQPPQDRNMRFWPDKPANLRRTLDNIRPLMNYYPPCAEAHKVVGFAPHSDSDLLTLVLQVNEVQGLQIRGREDGSWVPVKPVEGSLVVNVGDIFEIFTNGRYRSIEHRAMINTEKERLSVAAFHSPSVHATIGPLREVMAHGEEVLYKTVDHERSMRLFFSAKLEGKSFLQRMKLT